MKKILHIIIDLNIGGAELMLKRLVNSHSCTFNGQHIVVSLTTIGKVGEMLKASGIEVTALGLSSAFNAPIVFWRLIRLIRKNKPDIIQCWMYHADLLGGLAALLCGNLNIIWGIRATNISSGCSRVTEWLRKVCAGLSSRIPKIIVCAANAARLSHQSIGYDATRMVVIPNGFDFSGLHATFEQRQHLRKQYGIAEDEVVVGSLCRFNADKDPYNFVLAARELAPCYPKLRFLMVGRGQQIDNTTLSNWLEQSGCADRFILLGERTDVAICFSAMDIFCLHSRTEAFPNVLGEAMAMGLPCISTDVGDAAIMLGDTGIVIPKESAIELAKGVATALKMSIEARVAMGRRARERVISEFSMEKSCSRFEQIYQQLLTGKKRN